MPKGGRRWRRGERLHTYDGAAHRGSSLAKGMGWCTCGMEQPGSLAMPVLYHLRGGKTCQRLGSVRVCLHIDNTGGCCSCRRAMQVHMRVAAEEHSSLLADAC